MPVNPTYPGVYIEEVPSGVHTITGVATSITAFIGRAISGPVNQAVTITSIGDFERTFGGLGVDYPMSYAVQDFFLNGGSQAIIVRLNKGGTRASITLPAEVTSPPASPLGVDALTLRAANVGSWGNNLQAVVNYDGVSDLSSFNLIVSQIDPITNQITNTETFLNVSVHHTDVNYIGRMLKQSSSLVRVQTKTDPPDPNDPDPWVVPLTPPAIIPADHPIKADPGSGSNGGALTTSDDFIGSQAKKTGLFALEQADLFNLLCIPPDTRNGDLVAGVYGQALSYCVTRRAMLIVDPPANWGNDGGQALLSDPRTALTRDINLNGTDMRNAALFFPRVKEADPLRKGQIDTFVPCGIIAGVMARTDTQRGVWKAPAGLDAGLTGTQGLQVNLTDRENGILNPVGINCLRSFPVAGRVVWGSRTLRGADVLADEYKYIPVRRLALFIEESLYRGTQWVVFEPNDEPLWAQIRLNVGAFMQNLFRQGAFQGQTPKDAYFVKCDKESTTQNDINLGIVNIVVGFAPLKPAEFVIIKLQQLAGQIAV